jgi:hypothetical protein
MIADFSSTVSARRVILNTGFLFSSKSSICHSPFLF